MATKNKCGCDDCANMTETYFCAPCVEHQCATRHLAGKPECNVPGAYSAAPAFHLGDDGTLDTVIVCDHCGAELRYNFEPDEEGREGDGAYDEFIDWCLAEAPSDHVCGDEGSV